MTTFSYVSGTSTTPLIGETIGAFFDHAVERWPNREALIVSYQDIRWTYGQLADRVERLARGVLALGLRPGDRVGIWAPNRAEWVLTQFATAKAGLILVTINPAFRAHELEYALKKAGCTAIVTASRFKNSDYLDMLASVMPRLPELRHVIYLGDLPKSREGLLSFAKMAEGGPSEIPNDLQFDDPINIQFTSGTTGDPKGATLSHHNILNNAYFVARAMGLREGDRLCIPVPLYHCFGMVMSTLACITQGATMVFPSEAFDPLAVLETVQAERCTALHGVPTMFIAEMGHPDFARYDLSSLRAGIMAGAPCPIEVMRRVMNLMHLGEITIAYGMTETSPVSFQSAIDDPIERRVSTIGRIHPHLEVKIVDVNGRVVPCGIPGELLTRGYSVMRGYWEDDDRTAEAIDAAGWMHTGDLATLDAEGYCNIVGRIKDMVIRGGENIYPREVEEFLFTHPKIEAAQVFGVPDPKYGEVAAVWVKLRAGATMEEAEVRAYCQGRIAHYKIPKYVRFVDTFPMTVTGKAQKYLMREQTMTWLQLADSQTA